MLEDISELLDKVAVEEAAKDPDFQTGLAFLSKEGDKIDPEFRSDVTTWLFADIAKRYRLEPEQVNSAVRLGKTLLIQERVDGE